MKRPLGGLLLAAALSLALVWGGVQGDKPWMLLLGVFGLWGALIYALWRFPAPPEDDETGGCCGGGCACR